MRNSNLIITENYDNQLSFIAEVEDENSFGYLYKTLNDEQKDVIDRMIMGENIFITGNAGTGKSYVVRAFDRYCEEQKIDLIKTAPTGISANEIDGATLHHQFKLKIGLDFEKPLKYPKCLDFTDVLLIDEISMVRLDVFDKVMQLLVLANSTRARKKKRPIQIILVGDFYQLAPVISKEEKPYLEEFYGMDIKDGYCFQSQWWQYLDIKMCNLTTVMRQDDIAFCKALDKCKRGDNSFVTYVRNNCSKTEIEGGIWVCGRNITVSNKNSEELAKIEGKLHTSIARYHGKCDKSDKLCDEVFEYKIGARVVMLANDNVSGAYQNGTLATIVGVAKDMIRIELDNGKRHLVGKQKISKYEYSYKESVSVVNQNGQNVEKTTKKLSQKEIGYAEQYPMRLGYAVTIHKSQGQTYDKMNLNPEIFSKGQLYVALSRCRSIENLYIKGFITNRMIMTSEEVVAYYDNPEGYSFFNPKEVMKEITVPEKYVTQIEEIIEALNRGDEVIINPKTKKSWW